MKVLVSFYRKVLVCFALFKFISIWFNWVQNQLIKQKHSSL